MGQWKRFTSGSPSSKREQCPLLPRRVANLALGRVVGLEFERLNNTRCQLCAGQHRRCSNVHVHGLLHEEVAVRPASVQVRAGVVAIHVGLQDERAAPGARSRGAQGLLAAHACS